MEPPSRRLIDAQVMATGGKSYPKMGTDGTGWAVLQRLGHSLKAPYPALTPLKGSHPGGAQLAGEAEDSNYPKQTVANVASLPSARSPDKVQSIAQLHGARSSTAVEPGHSGVGIEFRRRRSTAAEVPIPSLTPLPCGRRPDGARRAAGRTQGQGQDQAGGGAARQPAVQPPRRHRAGSAGPVAPCGDGAGARHAAARQGLTS